MYEVTSQGLRRLVNAIILQACDDYKRAYSGTYVDKDKRTNSSEYILMEVEEFFLSDYFAGMCNIDPEWLMHELRRHSNDKKLNVKGYRSIL